jgi:hypothetical protein
LPPAESPEVAPQQEGLPALGGTDPGAYQPVRVKVKESRLQAWMRFANPVSPDLSV